MAALLGLIGVLCLIGAVVCHREDKRRRDFEDYVWYRMDDHGWHDSKRKGKKRKY